MLLLLALGAIEARSADRGGRRQGRVGRLLVGHGGRVGEGARGGSQGSAGRLLKRVSRESNVYTDSKEMQRRRRRGDHVGGVEVGRGEGGVRARRRQGNVEMEGANKAAGRGLERRKERKRNREEERERTGQGDAEDPTPNSDGKS